MNTFLKKLHVAAGLVFITTTQALYSQNIPGCGQWQVSEHWFKQHPELRAAYQKLQETQPAENCKTSQATAAPAYTIPMVFHILHTGGPENISDAQIIDEVAILNRDYQKQNADTLSVVPSFTNNIANVGFAFQLARIDPDGNCTNGIIRHYTTNTDWDANDFSLFTYSWPTNKYLNVYIVRSLNIAATAYAFLPGVPVPSNADVIVSMHTMCGSIGTSNVNTSRVITHEVGHWFNLAHIWGVSNAPGVACGDDGVSDTPITKGFTVCSSPMNATVCTPGVAENYQNYMDYSPCKIMFTNGQANRMLTCMNGTQNGRNNISSPSNHLATGVTGSVSNCIPQVELSVSPAATLCAGSSLTCKAYTCNAQTDTYAWTASSGAVISAASGSATSISFPVAGVYVISCVVSNSIGSSSASMAISVVNAAAQINSTYQESFESTLLPPNWSVINPTSSVPFWNITNLGASHGLQSMYLSAENMPGGSVAVLESPSYDFLNNPGSMFSFKYAYAKKSIIYNDVFKVQASKDCGGTFTDIYVPGATAMANGSGGVSSALFSPTPDQWKSYDVSAHPNFVSFLNKSNVIFRFYFKEDSLGFGNRLYLDQINFDSPNGLNEQQRNFDLNVFPNPSTFFVQLTLSLDDAAYVAIELSDLSGRILKTQDRRFYAAGNYTPHFDYGNIPAGIYFLNLRINNQTIVKKICVE